MERKLATIQTIESLNPSEGADRIEVCCFHNNSWRVVVEKGVHTVGDQVVYFEIDSILPPNEAYGFLERYSWRVKTIRLRGQLSQGVVLPIRILTQLNDYYGFADGDDVTEVLGVTKYEPVLPAQLRGQAKGSFPHWIQKTDSERLQNCGFLLESCLGKEFIGHEKLDGSSCTVYFRDGDFGVCSRNLELTETEGNSFWALARKLNLEELLRTYGRNIALQMELVGPGVQKNRYQLKEITGYLFDIWDVDNGCYFPTLKAKDIARDMGLTWTPWIGNMVLDGTQSVESLLAFAEGKSVLNPTTEREGIVWRPIEEEFQRNIGRVAFKTISNKYLLKYEE